MITLKEIETLPFIKVTEKNNLIPVLSDDMRIVLAKNGNKYFFDGQEVFYYSNGTDFFFSEIEQDLTALIELIK